MQHENRQDKEATDYQEQLQEILERPLSPENINTYAEDAVRDVIELSDQCQEEFRQQIMVDPTLTPKEFEDIVFEHFGLEDVDIIVDSLARKADIISGLNKIIAGSNKTNRVIVPPQDSEPIVGPGEHRFEQGRVIPRLKTLLFVLQTQFSVDLADKKAVEITEGDINQGMVREEPYYYVDVKQLDRVVLVCDQVGNVTYVFDSNELAKYGISADDIMELQKPDLDDLIRMQPDIGSRLGYGTNYASNLVDLIKDPATPVNNTSPNQNILFPDAPDDVLAVTPFCNSISASVRNVKSVMDDLKKALGPVDTYRFGSRLVGGLTPVQQKIIIKELERRGQIAEKASPDEITIAAFAKYLGLDFSLVRRSMDRLGIDESQMELRLWGEGKGTRVRPILSIDQQLAIIDELEQRGTISADVGDESEKHIADLARSLGVGYSSVTRVIKDLGMSDELVKKRIPDSRRLVVFLNTEQQKRIEERLNEQGFFLPEMPEDRSTERQLSDEFGVDLLTVKRSAKRLGDALGDQEMFFKQGKRLVGFTDEQKKIIRKDLEERGAFAPKAPEDYLSKVGMRDKFERDYKVIEAAIKELGDRLGEVDIYRFGSQAAEGYSPTQQRMILRQIELHHRRKRRG